MFVLNKTECAWHSGSGDDYYFTKVFLDKEQAMKWIDLDIAEHIRFYSEGQVCPYGYVLARDFGWRDNGLWTPEVRAIEGEDSCKSGWQIGERTLWFVHPKDSEEEKWMRGPDGFKLLKEKSVEWLEAHDVISLRYSGHEIDVEKELEDRRNGVLPPVFAEDPYK